MLSVAQRHEARVVEYLCLRLLTPCDQSRSLNDEDLTLHSSIKLLVHMYIFLLLFLIVYFSTTGKKLTTQWSNLQCMVWSVECNEISAEIYRLVAVIGSISTNICPLMPNCFFEC
jgi:hypothetical protein